MSFPAQLIMFLSTLALPVQQGIPPGFTPIFNGVDWTDSANHSADGAVEEMIALQIHFTSKRPRL